jgi:lantibiotic modifying enzyme
MSALALAPLSVRTAVELASRAQSPARPWLSAASKADHWLRMSAQGSARGTAWPVDPAMPAGIRMDLYTGMAGIVLFYVELHHATGLPDALRLARSGADSLLASLPDESPDQPMGLYTGVAGIAVVLAHAYRATDDDRYRTGVARCLTLLSRAARDVQGGIEWNESTDIVSGSAGIGLALLSLTPYAPRDVDVRRLATAAGTALVLRGQEAGDGLTWLVQPGMPRNYPNFSHGTAGVATFLARASAASRRRELLEAAQAGERWLRGLMTPTLRGGRMIYHSTPGNEGLYYLGWCHGPAGTARLYRTLAEVTGDVTYDERVKQLAAGIVDMKVPERSPGFWNNVSQCCGNCGVSEFFVALNRRTGDPRQLEFAEEVAHDTLARATVEGDGWKWVQAEHRVRPEDVVAQTGLMQGAAGVGLAMLHLDGAREGRAPFVRLPDEAL